MARCDWERMFWIFSQEDIFLYLNLTRGWLKTKNVSTSSSDPAESIHVCILDVSNWKGRTWSAPLAYAKLGSAMLHPETAEQVMWLHEWASDVVTCTKVCKELLRMLLPQPPGARICAARGLAAGKIFHGKVGLGIWKHGHWWDPHPTPREPLGGVWTLAYIKEQDPWKKTTRQKYT